MIVWRVTQTPQHAKDRVECCVMHWFSSVSNCSRWRVLLFVPSAATTDRCAYVPLEQTNQIPSIFVPGRSPFTNSPLPVASIRTVPATEYACSSSSSPRRSLRSNDGTAKPCLRAENTWFENVVFDESRYAGTGGSRSEECRNKHDVQRQSRRVRAVGTGTFFAYFHWGGRKNPQNHPGIGQLAVTHLQFGSSEFFSSASSFQENTRTSLYFSGNQSIRGIDYCCRLKLHIAVYPRQV